jgi:hypothetical protein
LLINEKVLIVRKNVIARPALIVHAIVGIFPPSGLSLFGTAKKNDAFIKKNLGGRVSLSGVEMFRFRWTKSKKTKTRVTRRNIHCLRGIKKGRPRRIKVS